MLFPQEIGMAATVNPGSRRTKRFGFLLPLNALCGTPGTVLTQMIVRGGAYFILCAALPGFLPESLAFSWLNRLISNLILWE
jgi:hypothetical protein